LNLLLVSPDKGSTNVHLGWTKRTQTAMEPIMQILMTKVAGPIFWTFVLAILLSF